MESVADEKLAVDLGTEFLVEEKRAVVARGKPGRRRVLVIAHPKLKPAKLAAELRRIADLVEEL